MWLLRSLVPQEDQAQDRVGLAHPFSEALPPLTSQKPSTGSGLGTMILRTVEDYRRLVTSSSLCLKILCQFPCIYRQQNLKSAKGSHGVSLFKTNKKRESGKPHPGGQPGWERG